MSLKSIQAAAKKILQPEVERFVGEIFTKMKATINQETVIDSLKISYGSNEDFFKDFKRRRLLMTHMQWEAKSGNMIILNSLEAAIAMAGYMWTLPSATVETKVKARDLDDELKDVYKEVSNQLYGSVNQYVTAYRDPEAQLQYKMDDLPVNGKKNDQVEAGDYLVLVLSIKVGEQAPSSFFFLISENLIPELFDVGEDFSLEASEAGEAGGLIDGSLEKTPAERIMITDYPLIDVDKTVGDAWDMMVENEVEALPVVEDETKVLRMITKNNIEIMKSVFFDAPGMDERRARVMCVPLTFVNKNQDLWSAKPTDSVAKVVRLMIDHKISSIPILDSERNFLGHISLSHVLDLLVPSMSELTDVEKEGGAEGEEGEEGKENQEGKDDGSQEGDASEAKEAS